MKKLLSTIAVSAALGSSAAHAINIDGIDFTAGNTFQVGAIYEGEVIGDGIGNDNGLIDQQGEVLAGIGIIDAIRDKDGNTVWQNGDNGRELTLQFGGYVAERIVGGTSIDFSGGFANFYSDTNLDFDSSAGSIAASTATANNGNIWLNLLGAQNDLCDATCLNGAGTVITLSSTIASGDLLNIAQAFGAGFLDVDALGAGAANASFDTDAAGSLGQDVALSSSFNTQGAVGDFFASGSLDLKMQAIPEPATLALFGAGLLGIGAARLRRNS